MKKILVTRKLIKENLDRMSTYTQDIINNEYKKKIQISGPLLMNWKNLIIEKF